MAQSKIGNFQKIVRNYYRKYGRHNLPWRQTTNPYRVLVSEIMLQQTQVNRVIPYYKEFLKQFPTIKQLAEASLGDVLRVWQGLGYNRRAKMLHEAAKEIVKVYNGRIPREYDDLVQLPGVGDYTAKAVRVFAYNEPEILIETNVRSVYIHHFFPQNNNVTDKELLKCIEQSFPKRTEPRVWYAALMDYGAYLKKEIPNPSRKSKHYTKQKPFKGSNREVRGALLRAVGKKTQTLFQLEKLPFEGARISKQLLALEKEGMVTKKKEKYCLS